MAIALAILRTSLQMGSEDFKSAVPTNVYLPNKSKTCNWNVLPEPSLSPQKSYYRAGVSVPGTGA